MGEIGVVFGWLWCSWVYCIYRDKYEVRSCNEIISVYFFGIVVRLYIYLMYWSYFEMFFSFKRIKC